MKHIKPTFCLIFLCSICYCQNSWAQSWAWAQYIPWSLNIPPEEVPVLGVKVNNEAIVHDASGSAYVAGHILVGTGVPGPTGNANIFYIAKYNATGALVWFKHFGEPFGPDTKARDMVADAYGNLYVIGTFSGALSLSNNLTLTANDHDIFMAKFDVLGNVIWAKKIGGSGWDTGEGIALDPQGNILLTGRVKGTIVFGINAFSVDPSPDSPDYFIAKFDSNNGNALWVKRGSSSGTEAASGEEISINDEGEIFTAGWSYTDITINNTTYPFPQNSRFVAKHDAGGNLLWLKKFPGFDIKIACDKQGNAYITGWFSENITVGSVAFNIGDKTKGAYVGKIDGAGNVLWAKGILTEVYNESKGLSVDANDSCYVTGTMGDYLRGNLFVKKYQPDGMLAYTRITQKQNYDDVIIGNDISTDDEGNSYIAGKLDGNLFSFGNISVSGNYGYQWAKNIEQGVVAKLSATDILFPLDIDPGDWEEWPIPPDPDPTSRLKAYPNPSDDIITLHFLNSGRDTGYLGIYNQKGKLVHMQEFKGDLKQRISFREYGKGYFYARVVVGKESFAQTLIIK